MTAPRRRSARDPAVEVVIASKRWDKVPHAARLVRRTIAAAAPARARSAEVSVTLTNDRAMRAINKRWRGQDKPTNVLSFPAIALPGGRRQPHVLGDIAIAYETTRREAETENKPFGHHLSHLAVHGFLHLIGYDHEKDDDAETMERLERHILARLGIPDPYA
jgi:probable rRNA maturation factor